MAPTKKYTKVIITQVTGLKKVGHGTKVISELLKVAKLKVKKYRARFWEGGGLEAPSNKPRGR